MLIISLINDYFYQLNLASIKSVKIKLSEDYIKKSKLIA